MTTKYWIVRQIGSGEDIRVRVEADSREEAIEKAIQETAFPWRIRSKITARPAKEGEDDDRITLQWTP